MLHEVSREAADFVEAETSGQDLLVSRARTTSRSCSTSVIPILQDSRGPAGDQRSARPGGAYSRRHERTRRAGRRTRLADALGLLAAAAAVRSTRTRRRQRLDGSGLTVGPTAERHGCRAVSRFTCLVFANDPRFERLARAGAEAARRRRHRHEAASRCRQDELVKRGSAAATSTRFSSRWRAGRSSWVYEFWRSHDGDDDRLRLSRRPTPCSTGFARRAPTTRSERASQSSAACCTTIRRRSSWPGRRRRARSSSQVRRRRREQSRDILTNIWQWRLAGRASQAAR